jgi:hypothetical protein
MDDPRARFDAAMNDVDPRFSNAYARAGMVLFEIQYEAENDLATLFALIPLSIPAQLATQEGH